MRKLGSTAGVLTTDYMYRADNYRLQWIKTGPSSPYEGLQNLEYAYDAAGNVDWIKDYKASGGVQTLDFTYDALNRLTNGVSSGGSSGAYNESYGYADNQGGKAGNLTSKTGLGNYAYGAQAAGCPEGALSKPHAVVTAGSYTFCYDQNGNMRRRTMGSNTYTLTYDAENRLTGVSGAATATFVYDGDGKRVKATAGGVTTAYVGGYYEWTGSTSTSKKYYYASGQRLAMRVGGTLSWLLTDHLGSTAVTANASGTRTGELWYKPWGEYRGTAYGTTPTSYRFTGQREDATIVLYYYGARYYDPVAGRFTQPDTIVPEPDNPDSLNRYAYVLNNPLRYTDPTGHRECEDEECTSWVHPFTGRLFRPLRRFWLATPPTLASIAPGGAFGEGSINWGGQQVSVYQPPSVYAYTDGSYSRGSRCRSQACLDSFTIGDYWWGEDWGNTCVSAFQRQVNPIARGTWEPVHTTTVTAHAFSGRFSTREFFAGIAAGRQFEAESLPPTAEEIGTRAGQVAGAVDALNVIGGALQGLATMTHDDSYYLQRNNAGAYRVIIISVYEAYGGPYYVTAGGRYPVGPILPR